MGAAQDAEGRSAQIVVRMPAKVKTDIDALAAEHHVSAAMIVRMCIERSLGTVRRSLATETRRRVR